MQKAEDGRVAMHRLVNMRSLFAGARSMAELLEDLGADVMFPATKEFR
jgi:hypothetical protein